MPPGKPGFEYLSVHAIDGVAVITLQESDSMIEGEKVDGVVRELFELVETKKYPKIVLNLYNAGYMSSAMLAQLVRLQKTLKDQKGKIRLCCLRPPVMDAFKVAQFDRLFEIYEDEPTALKKF